MRNGCYINASSSIHPNGQIGEDGILHAIEPDYKDIIPANARRRMSRIVKMGVASGLDCISQDKEAGIDAILTATGFGCLTDTEKFLTQIFNNNEQLLNPTAFIQSTFNTIGAQIALMSGNHSYNNTYVHRGLSFESALIDAMMHLWEGRGNVLVGAADEATVSEKNVLERLNLLKSQALGEGAHFFTLSSLRNSETYAQLKAVEMFYGRFDGIDIVQKIKNFLEKNHVDAKQIKYLVIGLNKDWLQDHIYNHVEAVFSDIPVCHFKAVSGEYPTASAFAMWKSMEILKEQITDGYILIYNQYNSINHSLILLKKC